MPLKELTPDVLGRYFTFTIVGTRGAGKSTFGRWFIYNRPDLFFKREAFCFTNTSFNNEYKAAFPYVYTGWKDEVIREVLARQKTRVAAWQQKVDACKVRGHIAPEFPPEQEVVMYFDDLLSSNVRSTYKNTLDLLYAEGRHYKMTLFFLTQSAVALAPQHRQNTDAFVIFPVRSAQANETIFRELSALWTSKAAFARDLREATHRSDGFLTVITRYRFEDAYGNVMRIASSDQAAYTGAAAVIEPGAYKMTGSDLQWETRGLYVDANGISCDMSEHQAQLAEMYAAAAADDNGNGSEIDDTDGSDNDG